MEKDLKKYLKNGKFDNVLEKHSKTMSKIRGKNNKSTEIKLKMLLVRNSIKGWKLNYKNLQGKPDFYFPKHKVAIFVDGCYWHGCPKCGHIPKTRSEFWEAKLNKNRARDKRVTRILKEQGITVVRFWEHDLKKKELYSGVIKKINFILGTK